MNVNLENHFQRFSDEKNLSMQENKFFYQEGRHAKGDRDTETPRHFFITIFIFLLLSFQNTYAQCEICPELIQNPDITVNPLATSPVNNGNQSFGKLPAIPSGVEFWSSTYKTPHHIQYTAATGVCTKNPLTPLPPNSVIQNCIAAQGNNNEGFHQNINILNNQYYSYCIKVRYKRLNCETNQTNSNIAIRFAKDGPPISNNAILPLNENFDLNNDLSKYDFYLIGNPLVQNENENVFEKVIKPSIDFPNKNYNQFQIFHHSGSATVSILNASIKCLTTALSDFTSLSSNGLLFNFMPVLNHNGCTSGETYKWYIKGISTESQPTSTLENPTIDFSQYGNGTYKVCLKYKDCNGCCAEICKDVVIENTCGLNYTTNVCGTYNFNITNPNPNHTYNWTFVTGVTKSATSIEYSYHENGAYNVNLVVKDQNGNVVCQTTQTIKVQCFDDAERCLPLVDALLHKRISGLPTADANGNIHHGPFKWSVYAAQNGLNPSLQEGTKFLVRGTLIIDVPVTFRGCDWIFDGGSLMQANADLTFSGGHMAGCDKMWRGIELKSKTITMTGLELKDAEHAIFIYGSGKAKLENNIFINNWASVYSTNSSPLIYCFKNTFKGEGVLKPSFPNQSHYNSNSKSHTGIFANNCNNLLVDGTKGANTFQDMNNGILIENGSLTCNKNIFRNFTINGNSTNLLDASGYGILLLKNLSISTITYNSLKTGLIGIGSFYATPNSQIEISNNLDLSYFKLFGVVISSAKENGTFRIYDNKALEGNNTSINVGFITSPKKIFINNNTNINNNITGINIESISFGPDCIVSNNVITNNNNLNSFGIKIKSSSNKWTVKNNIINCGTYVFGSKGIDVANSHFNIFEDNTIYGTSTSTGFNLTSSNSNIYKCNKAEGGKTGFNFQNMNLSTNFNTNQMKNISSQGLQIQNAVISGVTYLGQISPQAYKGNSWFGTATSAKLDLGSPIKENEFIYNPALTLPSPPIPGATWKPSITLQGNTQITNWFTPDILKNNLSCTEPMYGAPSTSNSVNGVSILENAVLGLLIQNEYAEQNTWTGQTQVLQMIDNNPSLLTQSTILNSFYTTSSNIIKQYNNIEKQINNIGNIGVQDRLVLDNWHSNLTTLEQQFSVLLVDTLNQNYDQNINSKMTEMNGVINYINALNTQLEANEIVMANSYKAQVAALGVPYNFCNYYKTIYNATLDAIILGDAYVKNTYSAALKSIAEQCIYEVGNPVFLAQGLCSRFNIDYVNENNCIFGRSLEPENPINKSRLIALNPNPTSNLLQISTLANYNKVVVKNLAGKEVHSFDYSSEVNSETLNVSTIPVGMYLVEVYFLDGSHAVSKFIKVN